MARPLVSWVALVGLVFVTGCASYTPNAPLAKLDPNQGYRYNLLDRSDNSDELFVILTFSGGGTRAASLSYGVLEKLRETTVKVKGKEYNLLREVDVISSVSGGSFTAAYYGLHGDGIFEAQGRFRQNFLYNNVQGMLKGRLFNPYNWGRLMSSTFGRIELAQEVYQELLFDQSTFADLDGRKPFLMINATDMAKGSQFTFIQSQFDPMCADLGSVPIARAVAASSNFPVAFSPLTLNSFPGTCEYLEPRWLQNAMQDVEFNTRRYYRAKEIRSYQESERHYVHLLDGGVSDNIGLRGPLTALLSTDPDFSVLRMINLEKIDNLVVIVVDAKNQVLPPFDEQAKAPGVFSVIETSATTPLDNYSADTVGLLQAKLRELADARRRSADLHPLNIYSMYVGFDRLTAQEGRDRYLKIDTTFALPQKEVDDLRRIGGVLLEKSPCYRLLVGLDPLPGSPTCRF